MEWTQVLMIILGNAAVVVPLFLLNRTDMNHYRAEASADRRDILQLIRSIEQELKDFHGRLERQDAEFKAHLQYHNDERNKR